MLQGIGDRTLASQALGCRNVPAGRLFGSTEWRPILDGRQSDALDAERTRDELTNLMRWRLEKTLGYGFTHTLRLTNVTASRSTT